MRKLAFGYSTRCNIRCEHCVATEDLPAGRKMDHDKAKEIIVEMARAGVGGISFSAGEPFLYINEIAELVKLCRQIGIYTRIVTNSFCDIMASRFSPNRSSMPVVRSLSNAGAF